MQGRRLVPLAVMLFITGTATLTRFAGDVRSVAAVGLSGGGFAIGVGFTLLVLGLSGRIAK